MKIIALFYIDFLLFSIFIFVYPFFKFFSFLTIFHSKLSFQLAQNRYLIQIPSKVIRRFEKTLPANLKNTRYFLVHSVVNNIALNYLFIIYSHDLPVTVFIQCSLSNLQSSSSESSSSESSSSESSSSESSSSESSSSDSSSSESSSSESSILDFLHAR